MQKAIVFSIQRFSIHDGPGIRTAVFLKGCPLSCMWCHNPESHAPGAELAYTASRCIGCGRCVAACPTHALSMREDGLHYDCHACKHCFACVPICPTEARRIWGEEHSTDDLVDMLLRDRRYYEKSGGGVTLSGGEPLMHGDFVAELFTKLHARRVHTAIETSLWGGDKTIDALIPLTDLWMVDIKHMDDDRHLALCGVPVTPILKRIRLLSERGADCIIRVPVVVGESGTIENMRKMADYLLNETKFRRVELLPMHKLAEHKYASLHRSYPAAALDIPPVPLMRELREYLRGRGFIVPDSEDM